MNEWNEALWLTKFTFRRVKIKYYIGIILTILFAVFIGKTLASSLHISINSVEIMSIPLIDFIFLVYFTTVYQYVYTNLYGESISSFTWGSHSILLFNHLPIKKSTVVKHRFLINFSVSISSYAVFFIALYTFTPMMRELMNFPSFLIFAIIWMSFHVFISGLLSFLEISYRLSTLGLITVVLWIFIIVYLAILSITEASVSLLELTINAATIYPGFSIIISLSLALIGWGVGQQIMLRKMQRYDYL